MIEHDHKTKGLPYYGLYFLTSKILMIKDPDLIRQVMIKDFEYFVDRNSEANTKLLSGTSRTDVIWMKQMSNASGLCREIFSRLKKGVKVYQKS